ncbi:hypothetical protein [Pseudomonas ovata]|uniref:hypothetical protein n=1 Tax=Pseudomonas ovata TaxID=1839709 RepID=UPI000D692FBE|nr:hypothetical protein [Pseudomonas ovata]
MSDKSPGTTGIKALCGYCDEQILPDDKQLLTLYSNESLACPSCKRPQKLPEDQREALLAKTDPGKGYKYTVMGLGLFTVTSCVLMLIGAISSVVFMLATMIFLAGNFIARSVFTPSTDEWVVTLVDGE